MDTRAQRFSRRRERPLVLARLQQRAEMRKRYIAQIPRWRHPLIGYVLTLPIVGLAIVLVLLEKELIQHFFFPAAPMFLAIVLVALIWGTGPALLAVVLNTLALDYFYVPPFGQFTINTWSGILQLLPFFFAGIIIAIISGQREAARRNALFAEQALYEHTDELEQANQELEQLNQVKDQFISMASHELKTPITTIRGQAQMLLRRLSRQKELPKDLADIPAVLEKIDGQTRRLTALVDDLLDLSSIRAGKIGLRFSSCDLGEVCRSAVEDQALLSGREIALEAPDVPVVVKADGERLGQVVANLVSNAIKYSPESKPVRVSVRQSDKAVVIEVHDDGQGIPKGEQKRIFETFYRSPDAQTAKKSGWGLGLAICKDIVERHGGCIWCESSPREGSTFFVELPLK
ncbi:MAG: HAMP domain-containing histidine kinase [Chloroflexi bacterium]|nr:HAMP domain-containing histidine kinase [Chloroflexota bacterium]